MVNHANVNYYSIIKNPMDLGTIRKKLDQLHYATLNDVISDIRLVFRNAMQFNPPLSDYHTNASLFATNFEKVLAKMKETDFDDTMRNRHSANMCFLCSKEGLYFEPPDYYCNNATCNLKPDNKIKRGSTFFSSPDNKVHYCSRCYQTIDAATVAAEFESAEDKVTKEMFQERTNNDVIEETWVQCTFCYCWYHTICAMLNMRKNDAEKESHFMCPFCIVKYFDRERINVVDLNKIFPVKTPAPPANALPDQQQTTTTRRFLIYIPRAHARTC